MTRKEEIEKAAIDAEYDTLDTLHAFCNGAEWSDSNPEINLKEMNFLRLEEVSTLETQLKMAMNTLQDIANEDFRGNRPIASVKAYEAINKIKNYVQGS